MADRVVIMSRGGIEQIGTPQEIYRTPGTRFVAEFLGSSNIFQGKLVQGDGGRTALDTPLGRFDTVASEGARIGGAATLTVLDTKTHLAAERPAHARNVLPVRMIGEEFVGATATIYLEAAGGQEIRVQKGHDTLSDLPLEIGRELFAYWEPGDGHVIAEG